MFANFEAIFEIHIQWYVPGLDVVEISRNLLIVTDRNDELEALSTQAAEVFSHLEYDCEVRIELCADDRTRVVLLWIG